MATVDRTSPLARSRIVLSRSSANADTLAGQQIRICGRNFNADHGQRVRLFQAIMRRPSFRGSKKRHEPTLLKAAKDATVVEEIRW